MIPLSIDDGIASDRGCDISCMATPWLLSMGACLVFSALFSKLWRLNMLLGSGMRRVALKEKDVILPATIMFSLNLIILVCWTAISPLQFERVPVSNESWNTVGICASENESLGRGCLIALGVLNIGALILSCWQAYRARNHSDQFSEAKGIGIACYSWLQLTLVGVPVLLLIDQDDVTARYFVKCGLIFLFCMTLLCSLFVPIHRNKSLHDSGRNSRSGSVTISGININASTTSVISRKTSMGNDGNHQQH